MAKKRKVSIAFQERKCPKCGGKMGRNAKDLCHKCQAEMNLKNNTKRYSQEIKDYAKKLRDKGKKYKSIQKSIKRKFNIKISEGTICNWCKNPKNPKRKNELKCRGCGGKLKLDKDEPYILRCDCGCVYRICIVRKCLKCAEKAYMDENKSFREIRKKK